MKPCASSAPSESTLNFEFAVASLRSPRGAISARWVLTSRAQTLDAMGPGPIASSVCARDVSTHRAEIAPLGERREATANSKFSVLSEGALDAHGFIQDLLSTHPLHRG